MKDTKWHQRYREMKEALQLTNTDIADITGNSPNSVKTVTQPNRKLPRWLKLSIVIFERLHQEKKESN